MFEFMRNAFFALIGVVLTGMSIITIVITVTVVVKTIQRMRKGGE